MPRPKALQLENYRLKTHGTVSDAVQSARLRAVGPAAAGGSRRDIGTASAASHKVLGLDCPARWWRAPAREFARGSVQPAIADPYRGEHQDHYDELRELEHRRGLPGRRNPGQGMALPSENSSHSPNRAHNSRASIQSATSVIAAKGSRAPNGRRAQIGRRRSTVTGRNLTLSP